MSRKRKAGAFLRRRALAAAIAALLCAPAPLAHAYSSATVTAKNGAPLFDVTFVDANEQSILAQTLESAPSVYTLSPAAKQGVLDGLNYWAEMLGDGAQLRAPLPVFVSTNNDANASALTQCIAGTEPTTLPFHLQAIQSGKALAPVSVETQELSSLTADTAFSLIVLGKYLGGAKEGAAYGWHIDADTPLPRNEQAADYIGTVRHEMGHALGIAADIDAPSDDASPHCFVATTGQANSWNEHLIDQNGNAAKAGMAIVTSQEFKRLQAEDASLRAEDFFIVDNLQDNQPDAAQPTAGNLYFTGNHVNEVLDGVKFDGVSGLPVNSWEADEPEFSHLQTSGLMGHEPYCNYTVFLEAELAVMQDLGYAIDRKDYYGYSVYGNGRTLVNTLGYAARNAGKTAYLAGVYNQTPLGVGLHLYGSDNAVTQAADILTAGRGGTGIRIDGANNRVTVAAGTAVRADGYRGVGLLAAYGRNHVICQNGALSADGEGGVGALFDFGSSSNGAVDEYRGSYIRYKRDIDSCGNITESGNLAFDSPATSALNGPLVACYAVNGRLSGAAHAIYIAKNAFVKQIDVLENAAIHGDIVSDWKHFATEEGAYDAPADYAGEALQLRYNDALYDYDAYLPDLVTQLRFEADLRYDGKIDGADNMKLTVASGCLRYGGAADLVSVAVETGAALFGGDFAVNDMNQRIASGFTDDTTGKFINRGTIGAATPSADADTTLRIKGDLVSPGALRFTAYKNNIGRIEIVGDADLTGGALTIDPDGVYIPNAAYAVLPAPPFARAANGAAAAMLSVANGTLRADAFSLKPFATGMMNAAYADGALAFNPGDNLGDRTAAQQAAYAAVSAALAADQNGLGETYAPLYSLDAGRAKEALRDIHGGIQAGAAALVKSDRFVSDAVYARLAETSRAGGPLWARLQKSWRVLDENADRLGEVKDQLWQLAVGADKPLGDRWTAGVLLGYGRHSVTQGHASDKLDDYRAALYGRYALDALAFDAYLVYGRQEHAVSRRLAPLALTAGSDYHSDVWGVGLKASRDLQYGRQTDWHVRPYASLEAQRYRQRGYRETGARGYELQADAYRDNIVTAGLGVEAEKTLARGGSWGVRLGYRRVLSGETTAFPTRLTAAPNRPFTLESSCADKNTLSLGLHGEAEIRDGLSLQGELRQGFSPHARQFAAAAKAVWQF